MATTTSEPTTTTTSTTTTTIPPTTTTTTVSVIPPESGFYIVDPDRYPNGVPLSYEDLGYPQYSGLGSIGYMLEDGSEILRPFDGEFVSGCGTSTILRIGYPTSMLESNPAVWNDSTAESVAIEITGDALTFLCPVEPDPSALACWPCPVSTGDVIARVTDPDALIQGPWSANVVISLDSFSYSLGYYIASAEMMHEYFSFLP